MRCHIGFSLALVGVAIISSGSYSAAAEPDRISAPNPQEFLKQGKPADFVAPAKAYLEKQPEGEEAQRVVSDVLMVAMLVKDENLIRNTKLRVLADYPNSVTGRYLLSEMQPDAYVTFLTGALTRLDLQAEPRLLALWNRAVETGFQHYGPRFATDALLAQAALAAEDPDKGLSLRKSIRYVKEEDSPTLEIAFNREWTNRDKVVNLQAHTRNGGLANAYLRILYARLTPEEQADPKLAAVVAEPLLKDDEFAKAVAVLEKIPNISESRLLFWLAWAQGASGKNKEAVASLTSLVKNHPSSPWSKPAAELLPAMQELEKSVTEHASAADAAVIVLRESPPTLIELRARSRPEAKSPFAAYLSLDIPEDGVEVLVEKEGKTVAAVKVSANDNRMFVEGNSAIHQSQVRYDIPYFKPHLTDLGDGGWRVNYDFKRVPAGQALPANLTSLLKSAVLTKPGARHEYFRRLTRKGRFPAPVQISDEQRVFRWLTPQCDRPELLVTEVRLTKDNQIASASWGNSTFVEIKCGSRGELKLAPPVWPDLPLAKKEGADVSTVGQLMFYGLSVWQSLEFFTDGDTAYGPWVTAKESQ